MVDIENPMMVAVTANSMVTKVVSDEEHEYELWTISSPIPSAQTIGVCEVYHRQFLILAKSESGKYQIYHTADQINHTMVHSHDVEITYLGVIGFGKAIFCATDGWWMTLDSGMTWNQIALANPVARSLVAITTATDMVLLAYCDDRKIYRCEHSMREFADPMVWSVVYDSDDIYLGTMFLTLAGGVLAVIAGVGDKLIRTIDAGLNWQVIATVDGIVKNVITSDQSNCPDFLIEVEKDGIGRYYWSHDLGDSLIPDINRLAPIVSASGVIPTGSSEKDARFVIYGTKNNRRVCTLVNNA